MRCSAARSWWDLSHVQRMLTVLFGHASCFVKQLENRLACFVEAVAWSKRDYGIFCHVHTQSSELGGDLTNKTTKKQPDRALSI
jgi:hypothetical protein